MTDLKTVQSFFFLSPSPMFIGFSTYLCLVWYSISMRGIIWISSGEEIFGEHLSIRRWASGFHKPWSWLISPLVVSYAMFTMETIWKNTGGFVEDNIYTDLKEIVINWRNWVDLAQDSDYSCLCEFGIEPPISISHGIT